MLSKSKAGWRLWGVLLGLALWLGGGGMANALTFVVGSTNAVTNSDVVVLIRARDFTNITSFQFSFHWNTNVARFVQVEQFGAPAMTAGDFGTNFTPTGALTVAWIDQDVTGKTLVNDSVVFGARLHLVGPAAATSIAFIDGQPTPIIAGDQNLVQVQPTPTSVPGALNIDHTLLYACVGNKTVECGTPWGFDLPIIIDSCSGSPVGVTTNILSTTSNITSTCGFTMTRIWELLDQCNNRATCTQTVTAIDTTPPQLTFSPPNKTVELGDPWNFDIPTAVDLCVGAVANRVVGTITNRNGFCGSTYSATRTNEFLDGCSNRTVWIQTVTVRDTTAPRITCVPNKNVNCLQFWTFDEPTAIDVADGSIPQPTIISTTTNGSCGSGFTATRTWRALDACGNSATCSQTVFGRAIVSVSGTLFYPTNYPVVPSDKRIVGATVMGPTNTSSISVTDGTYNVVFDAASNVVITPLAPTSGNPADGVTVIDITLVRRHIQSVAILDTPYKLLAADVDGSSSISVIDLSHMRRLILGTNRFPIGLWRYLPANHTFANPTIPWSAPTNRVYGGVSSDQAGQDFLAIKLGDVNNSWTPPAADAPGKAADEPVKSAGDAPAVEEPPVAPDPPPPADPPAPTAAADAGPVTFSADSVEGVVGMDVSVPIRVTGFTNIVGFQFSLHWNTNIVTLLGLEQFGLPFPASMYTTNFARTGTLAVVWNDETGGSSSLPPDASVFSARFRCVGAPSNTTSLTFDSYPTMLEVAADVGGIPQAVPSAFLPGQVQLREATGVPIAAADSYSTPEDAPLVVAAPGVLSNDIDPESQPLTAVLAATPANGTVLLNANGSFNYTPNTNFSGSDSFAYRANDGTNNSAITTVNITVNPLNDPPVLAAIANKIVDELSLLSFTASASDPDGPPDFLTFSLDPGAPPGASINPSTGLFSWTPTEAQGPGSYPITVRVTDSGSPPRTDARNFTVFVNEVNSAPVANADSYPVNEDVPFTIAAPGVLANDTDAEGTALSAVLVSGPSHGTLAWNPNGSFTYTPGFNFNGTDSFTYAASDGQTSSAPATVTLTVSAVNDAPIAVADAFPVNEDTTLSVPAPGVLQNDSDAEGSVLTAVLVNTTTNGALALNADGSFTYVPATNFHGIDSFTYRANDGQTSSAPATVTITVAPVNDAPVANPDNYIVSEDAVFNAPAPGVLGNDVDVDGDVLSALRVTNPAHGTLALNADGSFTYTPAPAYSGPDSFSYFVSDGSVTSAPVNVNITVRSINHVPVANADSYPVNEDSTLAVGAPGVLANDSDSDGDALTAILATGPAHGTLALNGDGSFVYTPAGNFNGSDSFTYRASDGQSNSAPATVTLTINPVNDGPVAVNDTNYVTTESVPLNVPAATGVLANDIDVDGNALTAVLVNTTTNGALTLEPSGAFVYLPNASFRGVDHFTYRANDGASNSPLATVTITVLPANSGPVAGNDSYATDEDVALVIPAPGVLANDTDADGNPLSAILAGGPAHGTLTLNANGSFIFTPEGNFSGSDMFSYRASDGITNSSIAIVSLTVRSVNDAPVLAHIGNKSVLEGNLVTFTATATDVDVPAQALTYSLDPGAPAGAIIDPSSGVFTWTPGAVSAPSTFFITVRVTDNGAPAKSASETIAIGVNKVIHVSISDATVPGGTAGSLQAALEVTLSSESSETVSVDFATADGTALANTDYIPAAGTLVFPPGTTNQTIEVTVNGNPNALESRSFLVNLSNPTNAVVDDDQGLATIVTESAGGLAIDDVTIVEGDAGTANAVFTVNLSPPSDRMVTVKYAAAKGSALSLKDFKPKGGVLKFLPGVTSQTIAVPVVGEKLSESNETFTVKLSQSVNAVIAREEGTATIMDNDPLPTLTITDAAAVEPNGFSRLLNFTVRLSGRSGRTITVDFSTADGTAKAGSDYAPAVGTLVFPPNITTRKIGILIAGDTMSESNQSFSVNLSNPVNANIADGHGVGTIIDNDRLPAVFVDDTSADEGNAGEASALFTLRLSVASEKQVSVNFTTVNSSALDGTDFVGTNGVITFEPGATTVQLPVPLLGNTLAGDDRSFFLDISSPINATIGDRRAVGIIIDDDEATGAKAIAVAQKAAKGADDDFRIAAVRVQGTNIVLGIETRVGRTYVVETADGTGRNAVWTELPGTKPVSGTGRIATVTHVGGVSRGARFYRIRVLSE